MRPDCNAYTMSVKLNCILHKTANTFHRTRGQRIGIKDKDKKLSFYCEEEKRKERCKSEPKCYLDCKRKDLRPFRSF